jgi:hypothetical protein
MVHIDTAMNEHIRIAGIRKEIKVSTSCEPTIAHGCLSFSRGHMSGDLYFERKKA